MTAGPPDPPATHTESNRVVVMLGSNIEPARFLPEAVARLSQLGHVSAVSSVWQTAAIGDTQQADFCNAAVLLATPLTPADLLSELRSIESDLGRVRDPRNKNAARTIDLDLAVIPGPATTIAGKAFPDPDISERVFLAVPLQEICPEFILPDGRTIDDAANGLRQRDADRLRLQRRDDIVLRLQKPGS